MAFFQRLQDSWFTDWLLGSESIWTYPTVLTLHTVGLAVLVGASLIIHLRALGVGSSVSFAQLSPLRRLIWGGFAVNLITGVLLFITQAADRVVDPVFYVKLGCIAAALSLGVVVTRAADGTVPASGHRPGRTRVWAGAALGLWTVATVAGRLMAYLSD